MEYQEFEQPDPIEDNLELAELLQEYFAGIVKRYRLKRLDSKVYLPATMPIKDLAGLVSAILEYHTLLKEREEYRAGEGISPATVH